jgi:hypothetical protein
MVKYHTATLIRRDSEIGRSLVPQGGTRDDIIFYIVRKRRRFAIGEPSPLSLVSPKKPVIPSFCEESPSPKDSR